MKILNKSQEFLLSSRVLKLKTDISHDKGVGYNNHIRVHYYTSPEDFFLNLKCHKEYVEYSQIQIRLRSVMASALRKVS